MTSSADERWILCGGANHASAPEDALRLAVSGSDANLTVDIEGLATNLIANIPPVMKDLVRVASYVIAADQAFERGDADRIDLGDKWRRDLHFAIAVEEPDLWSSQEMVEVLQSTLGFLSDDNYSFEFQSVANRDPEQLKFTGPDGEPFAGGWNNIDAVQLFSGGMDSFGGAVQALGIDKQNPVLVSHRSAPKTWKTQRELVGDLQTWASRGAIPHVGIQVHKHDKALRKERTQRSRSFLYAAMAGTVAHIIGHDKIRFYENGITSFNLPISPQIVGARATRTTHPKVLLGFSQIISLARGKTMAVENPFELKTRAEVLDVIKGAGAAGMLRHTVSCAHIHRSSTMHPHCGVCSQCIDRRFSVLARSLEEEDPEDGYAVDLIKGDWKKDGDRALVLDYIDAADKFTSFAHADRFLGGYGEAARAIPAMMELSGQDGDAVAKNIFEMHQRHGKDVGRVISETMAKLAKCIRTPGGLSSESLPTILFARGQQNPGSNPAFDADPALKVESEYVFRQFGQNWTVRFRGGTAFSLKPTKGLTHIHTLLQRPGETLDAFAMIDIVEGNPVASRPMATAMGADDETIKSVREAYEKLKEQRDEAEEFSDEDTVAKCDDEIEKLANYLTAETGIGGKKRRENPEQKKARMTVTNAITRALKTIEKANKPCAKYLREQIKTGFFLKYRDTGVAWES
ncbi:MAG: hypothetical protein IPK13_00610 [Deltaproteobacteria bacterium]|nr:hypothetical protein [Deltaproteobacteria bacterium]